MGSMTSPLPPPYVSLNVEAHGHFSVVKWLTVAAYMLSMGVCGIVLVALGSTLEVLAHQVARTTTSIGSVFIARGSGSIFGSIICSKLYRWFPGKSVLLITLISIMVTLILLPFTSTVCQLYFYFFVLGLGTSITDTGCQLMTRKLHRKSAGPWLGANATVFGLSAALVPILEMSSSKLSIQYLILASIVALSCCLVLCASQLSRKDTEHQPVNLSVFTSNEAIQKEVHSLVPHYYSEIAISVMLFCFVGGSISATAYIESYIDQTGIISSHQKGNLVFVLWISITAGRIAGVQDQRSLSDSGLSNHLSFLCLGGFFAMSLIFILPQSHTAMWIGTALYGFFHGPTVGFCQDLNNRLTLPTEKSMAIVMFGLNCGASFVPYLTTVLWDAQGVGPSILIIVIGLSMLIPLPLLYFVQCVSYIDDQDQPVTVTFSYESIDEGNPDSSSIECI